MKKLVSNLGAYNKAAVAALGGVVVVVNEAAAVVPGAWATTILAALTAASVFLVKNQNLVEEVSAEAAR